MQPEDSTNKYNVELSKSTVIETSHTDVEGTILAGKYKLIEAIGEGGMGKVWLAHQSEPVKRRVAVKLIKRGMDSQQVLARFDAERQALAMMDHPNIAKVFDGGLTVDGRPFFVMELVKGVPITEYCDSHKLSPQQRLELFVPVCLAIQHAHQKGIIHRDIKPSNVLVALYDNNPVPKVIDFGVAKATGQPLSEHTINTGLGAVVGTPQYMSPEQATFNNLDIDTRSDIYSLGVLLYELLVGSPPFGSPQLRWVGPAEILRMVRDEEPQRPSLKLSSAEGLLTISTNRGTEPKKLTLLLRNELDWIVMKALEKDRTRRYETANGFAADVNRYLAGEPVQAHPPSAVYRFKKFTRKHVKEVIAATVVALGLLAGLALEVRSSNRVKLALVGETEARGQAELAAVAEKDAKEQAQRRLTQIEKGSAVLTSVFDDLDIRNVKEGTEPLEAGLAKRLVKAAQDLEGDAVGDPLVVAGLQHKLGKALMSLGFPNDALPLFQKVRETRTAKLETDHPDTLASTSDLASSYLETGKLTLSVSLYEETLKLMKAKLGVNHPDTLTCMNDLATSYLAAGKLALAVPLFEETLKLMKASPAGDNPDQLTCMNNLGTCYQYAGKPDLALPLFEETLALKKVKMGADHPDTLSGMNNLASSYQLNGKLDLALALYEETLKLKKAKLGVNHPSTLASMNNLASCYQAAGKLDLAVRIYEEAVKLKKAKLGADNPDTLLSINNLASCHIMAGKHDLAAPLLEDTLPVMKVKLGDSHPTTIACMRNLVRAYSAAGRAETATAMYKEFIAVERKRLPANSSELAGSLAIVVLELFKCGQYTLAEESLRECLTIREKLQPDAWTTFNTQSLLGGALLGQKKYADAEPLLLKGYEGMKQREKMIPPQGKTRIPDAADRLIELYTKLGKPDDAKKWQTERTKYPVPKQPTPVEKK